MDQRREAASERNGTERRLGVLRPFAIRDFRLLWTGMTVSLIGDGIFIVAMAWQVYELSNSPTLALVGLAWTAPMVVFLLLGGVIADRFDRRRVMILSDVIRAVAVGAMGALAVTGCSSSGTSTPLRLSTGQATPCSRPRSVPPSRTSSPSTCSCRRTRSTGSYGPSPCSSWGRPSAACWWTPSASAPSSCSTRERSSSR